MKILEKKLTIPAHLSEEAKVDKSLPDLSSHPVVLKKAEAARAFLEAHPVPKHLLKR